MILKSLEKYFILSFHWCGHLCLSCVYVFGGDTWTPHHFFFFFFFLMCVAAVPNVSAKWGLLKLRSDLTLFWLRNVQLLPTAWRPLLLQWVCRVLLSPAFFLCLPLYPWSTASLTAGPPHPHCLLRVLRVGLFLILSASACSNLAWASHLCSNVTTAKRPSCLGRNRISAPLSLAAPSPPAVLAAGMFSVLLGFEDIFLLFHFGFPAPHISCAFHIGGLTSREKASPALTLPSEYLASLSLLLHVHLEGFADVCRDGGHTQISTWFF